MKAIVIGGDIETGRKSKIVKSISNILKCKLYNGVLPKNISGNDLTIWMPNISNETEKIYPKKDIGSVMVVSKVIGVRNRTRLDAVKRIFDFGANAVIAIDKSSEKMCFELIDALDNTWCKSTNIEDIINKILELYEWTKGSIRKSIKKDTSVSNLIELNNKLSKVVKAKTGKRFFGNLSTRCIKLFPSFRINETNILVSPRNIDKSNISEDDMILINSTNDDKSYIGTKKPSVDTPIQLEIYKDYPSINFIIHGHLIVDELETTEHYFPCGDMREIDEIKKMLNNNIYAFNLKNHGFLFCANTLDELEAYVSKITNK